jgi:hypothetical protein
MLCVCPTVPILFNMLCVCPTVSILFIMLSVCLSHCTDIIPPLMMVHRHQNMLCQIFF